MVELSYDTMEGSYNSSIFTAEKKGRTFDRAFHAIKAIQEYGGCKYEI